MIEVGSRVVTQDGHEGLIIQMDSAVYDIPNLSLIETTNGLKVWRCTNTLIDIGFKKCFELTDDGPEVDILKAYHQGLLNKATTLVVLMAINQYRKGSPCVY